MAKVEVTLRHERAIRGARTMPLLLLVALLGHIGLYQHSFTFNLLGTLTCRSSSWHKSTPFPNSQAAVVMKALPWEVDKPPRPPSDRDYMLQQAADAAMRAYRDGITRQSLRFRVDSFFDTESTYIKGPGGALNKTLPAAQRILQNLWGGTVDYDINTSAVDEFTSTLLYGEAESEFQDVAMFYMPNREFAASAAAKNFVRNMKDRLVLVCNSQYSNSPFQIENLGSEFANEGVMEQGYDFTKTFQEQTYYYYTGPFANWQMTTFRAYPFDWEIFVEDFNTTALVKIADFPKKPKPEELSNILYAFEQEMGILPLKKIEKMQKIMRGQEDAAEERTPGWRR